MMVCTRPSTKAVVTASVSAALAAAVALMGLHRRYGRFAGRPDVVSAPGRPLGASRTALAELEPKYHAQDQLLGRSRRALPGLELERSQVEVSTGGGEEDGAGGRFSPSEGSSAVMFLHIFKCAGSTLRRMLVDWAIERGGNGAIVVSCFHPEEEDKICLDDHELLDEPLQEEIMSRQQVLAGHFIWGFQRHVKRPYVMVTSLRNPLEVWVSGKQFLHPDMVKSLDHARELISSAMLDWLGTGDPGVLEESGGTGKKSERWTGAEGNVLAAARDTQEQRGGFIFRLTGDDKKALHGDRLAGAAQEAMRNLEEFWVVGVVEQYAGFLEVLRRLLDPEHRHQELWNKYSRKRLNSSPVQTREILAAIDPELVSRFNGSLALQWEIYQKAASLWDVRCREVLPTKEHTTPVDDAEADVQSITDSASGAWGQSLPPAPAQPVSLPP